MTSLKKYGIILVIVCSVGLLYRTHHYRDSHRKTRTESSFSAFSFLANHTVQDNCDSECRRFKSFMVYDWSQQRPSAAIYVLTNKFTNILKLLRNVEKTFNSATKYPYIIFHEEDFSHFRTEIGRQKLPHSRIFYQMVDFKNLPDHITMEEYNNAIGQHCNNKPIGYRLMSYFNSKVVYTYAIMDQLEYILQLDDDSEFLQPITYDVFKVMRDGNFDYGYLTILNDQVDCMFSLWEMVAEYTRRKRIRPTFFHSWQKPNIFYNNFELSKLSIWRQQHLKKFFTYNSLFCKRK